MGLLWNCYGLLLDLTLMKVRSVPINSRTLEQQLSILCGNIALHMTSVSDTSARMRVTRMVLTFKMDVDQRLWLLWCTSLR